MLDTLSKREMFVGQFLPTIRELADEHGVSRETVRRVLKMLEEEGFLASEPRHGYRILRLSNQDAELLPVAFVISSSESVGGLSDFYRLQLRTLQDAAEDRGWAFLGVGAQDRQPEEIRKLLETSRVSGIVLNSDKPEVTELVVGFGVPVVALESWIEGIPGDMVEQDSFRGAFRSGEFIAGRGHKRIGWVGPVGRSPQSLQRWGGVVAALRKHDLEVSNDCVLGHGACEDAERVRELIARPDRPTALIAPWRGPAFLAAKAARDLGLVLGKDIDIVGWNTEEQRAESLSERPAGIEIPTVYWSMREMSRTAIRLLAERIRQNQEERIQAVIPTRLEIPTDWPAFGGKS